MTRLRKLNSDQLGQKGESRFREICSDAKLVCNGSTYDRTGWDFIVEFPFDLSESITTLDKRQVPLSCHIQVKTMWADNNAFSVRLSSAERLAKEPKPTFFCIFKVDDNLNFVAAYLLFVLDDLLEKILKRLREEHAKGVAGSNLNQKSIRFNVDSSKGFMQPTGSGLREALAMLCEPDPDACMRKKSEQLKNLGFEANAYQAETTFVLEDDNEIVEVLLGLKSVQVSKFRAFETRFGVKLPLTDQTSEQGVMHIQPEPADQCVVTVKGEGVPMPAAFQADIFLPPIVVPKESSMLLIRAKSFEIQVRQRKISFSTNPEVATSIRQTFQEWIQFFRMLVILSQGVGTVTVVPTKLARGSMPIKLDEALNLADHSNMLKAFECAAVLFELAGALQPAVLQADVLAVGGRIIGIAELFANPSSAPSLKFRSPWQDDKIAPEVIDVLYVDAIEVAGVQLAFSAIAEMTHQFDGSILQWVSRTIRPREITIVRDLKEDYERFCERSKSETGISTVMIATYETPG